MCDHPCCVGLCPHGWGFVEQVNDRSIIRPRWLCNRWQQGTFHSGWWKPGHFSIPTGLCRDSKCGRHLNVNHKHIIRFYWSDLQWFSPTVYSDMKLLWYNTPLPFGSLFTFVQVPSVCSLCMNPQTHLWTLMLLLSLLINTDCSLV